KRFKHEVIQWNACTFEQKTSIETRLSELLTTIVDHRISITDKALLASQLHVQPVHLPSHRNLQCQLFELIKAGASQIDDTSKFGFEVNYPFQHIPLRELYDDMDQEFFHLSMAHYQRYFTQYC
ncbi:MAG: DUF1289 domain-containing protein, partial [Sinobacterium sp.]|nr:DUF1289 domain-containing protein [Sinobacterium sp.]